MNSKKELKTGIFIIVTLLAVVLTVNYLRGNGFFQRSRTYITSYSNAMGISPSTPVYIRGFKVGSISSVTFNRESQDFEVTMEISPDFEIPEDSYTEIYSSDILGGKSVRIIYGTSTQNAVPGSRFKGYICDDPISDIISGISPVIQRLDTLAANLNTTVVSLNAILDEEGKADISSMIKNLSRSAENIKGIAEGINGKTPEIQEMITNLKELSAAIKKSAVKLDSTLANTQSVTAALKEAEIKETVENLNSLIKKIQDPAGSIGQLMSTDTLHNSINELVMDLDTLVNKIKENPRKNLKISVF